MVEEIIIDLINKYDKDIIMLDGLLQWALNPTSMSASYGIKENYPYIKENLKLTHLLSDSKAEELISKLELECETFLKLKKDKYSIGNFQKLIIEELSKNRYIKLFEDFILKKKEKASKNTIRFLQIYKYSPIKNFPCLNVKYNAIYGEEIDENEIVSLGILKPLYWISSGSSGNREVIPKFIPFLEVIIDNLKLKKIKPNKPNPAEFIQTLKKSRDRITLDFLINLMKRDQLCDLLFNNQKVITRKGIVGFYSNPHSKEFNYAGISFLVYFQNNLMTKYEKELYKKLIPLLIISICSFIPVLLLDIDLRIIFWSIFILIFLLYASEFLKAFKFKNQASKVNEIYNQYYKLSKHNNEEWYTIGILRLLQEYSVILIKALPVSNNVYEDNEDRLNIEIKQVIEEIQELFKT